MITSISDVNIAKEITIKQFSRFPRREKPSSINHVTTKLAKHWMTLVDGEKWKRLSQGVISYGLSHILVHVGLKKVLD